MNASLPFSYALYLFDVAKEHDDRKRNNRLQGLAQHLVTAKRAHLMPEIKKAYADLSAHAGKHSRVRAQSAKPLSEKDVTTLKKTTEEILDAALDFQIEVNPSLIGGAKVLIDDRLYDFSYHAQLQQLHSRFRTCQ